MKLRAVRLSEVGHFRSGVALEGMSGGFDVLAGPNEMGKSTIFRAIRTLFRYPHTTTHTDARDLAPAAGGAPLIEVDFEVDGRLWRIRKRYLNQRSALLIDLGGGNPVRGADAETKLAQLFAGRLDRSAMAGLMWVGQHKSIELPAGEVELSKGLGRLIEEEVAEAGGAGSARRVREEVAKALQGLVNKVRRTPPAGTAHAAAIEARDRAKAEFENAKAAALLAAKRLADLEAARARLDAIQSPEATAARADTLVRLRERHRSVVRAEEELRVAAQIVAVKDAHHNQARIRHDSLDKDMAEAARLRELLLAGGDAKSRLSEEVVHATAALADLRQSREAARKRAVDAQAQIELFDRHTRAQAIAQRVVELSQRLSLVKINTQRLAAIDADLGANPMTDLALQEVRRAFAGVERLEARVAAALPRVRIDYLAGAAGRIRVAGRPIATNGELSASETVVLDIEGVGRVTVMAPTATSGADESVHSSLEKARSQLSELLGRLMITDVSGAEILHAARTKLAAERNDLNARLAADAPDGLAQLSNRHDLAVVELDGLRTTDAPPAVPRVELQALLDAARKEADTFDAAESAAQAALRDASNRETRAASEHANAAARLAQLETTLPPVIDAPAALTVAAAELETAGSALNSALRDQGAWKAAIPDPAVRAALDRDLATAELADKQAKQSLQSLAVEIRGLEAALERDRQDGVEARVVELEERLVSTEARVAGFATEVRELELLQKLLDEQDEARRSTELAPVVKRLQVLARNILPGSVFELGDALRVSGVVRAGQSLSPQRLSGGTQEQLSILVRLAYGRLLADRGAAMPLVLDDALVYSDDARFASVIGLIAEASVHHQVVMLTCQAGRIAKICPSLPATLVNIIDWRPE